MVGAPSEDQAGGPSDTGTLFVFLGGPSGLTTGTHYFADDLSNANNQESNELGASIAVGDIDGDGRDDVVAGEPGWDNNKGAFVVAYGQPDGSLGQGVRRNQPTLGCGKAEQGDRFGESAAVGDINADGFDDVAVGAPGENTGTGVVCVIFGSASGLRSRGKNYFQDRYVSEAREEGDRFGEALALSKVDDDKYADLIVGAPNEELDGKADAGLVSVLFGKPSIDPDDPSKNAFRSGVLVEQSDAGGNDEPDDHFGSAVAGMRRDGDVIPPDDDLRFAVGTPYEEYGGRTSGNAHAFPAATSGYSLLPAGDPLGEFRTDDLAGDALALGDLNGDGWTDLAVGAPGGSGTAGRIVLLQGHPDGFASGTGIDQTDLGVDNEPGDAFGSALAAGDFDNDGALDLAIGAPTEGPFGQPISGLVTIIPGKLAVAELTHGPFVGNMSDTGFTVWIRGSQPASWQVEVWPRAGGPTQTFPGTGLAEATDFTGTATVTGLSPDTEYWYRVRFDDKITPGGFQTTFPSAGSQSQVRFAFAADFSFQHQPFSIFDRVRAKQPDFVMLGGDNIYADHGRVVPNTDEGYFHRYRASFDDGPMTSALRSIPAFTTWDDHEITNDADGNHERFAAAKAGFDAYQAPHNPAAGDNLYYSFQAGPADVFVLDTRSHRGGASMLGSVQFEALTDWLDDSNAKFKVIVSSVPFTEYANTNGDAWDGYPVERDAIFDHIATGGPAGQNIKGVVLVTGDQHWSGVFEHDIGTTTIYEFMPTPAAIGMRNANPAFVPRPGSHEYVNDWDQVFGLFRLDNRSGNTKLVFKLVTADGGDTLHTVVLNATDLGW